MHYLARENVHFAHAISIPFFVSGQERGLLKYNYRGLQKHDKTDPV
jgi:hypothetical protein